MTARGDTTRAKLIAATTEVVREVGYARATTREIARRAGVAEGTMYRHFPDKAALFFAAFEERNAGLLEEIARLPKQAGSRTVRDNLRQSLTRLATLRDEILPLELSLRADPDLARDHQRVLTELPEGPPPGPPRHLAAYLAAEQRLGRIRPDIDPIATAITLLATLIGLALLPQLPNGAGTSHFLDAAVDITLEGIEPRT